MPLPIPPSKKPAEPAARAVEPDSTALPLPQEEPEGPTALPSIEEAPAKPARKKLRKLRGSAPDEVVDSFPESDGWAVDPKTGKRYKKLIANPQEAIKAHKASKGAGLTVEQLFTYTKDDPDFSLDDLNGAADTFLAHLRVPPSKEELAQARKELADKRRKAAEAEVRNKPDLEEE